MSESQPEQPVENSWVDIVGGVLSYYEKDREGNMFGMHGMKAYPVASLAFLRIDPSKYAPEDLAEAFRGISEHLHAHIKNGTARIGTLGTATNPDEIPRGESPSVDIALGRTETTSAELGKMLLDNMQQLSLDDEQYYYSYQQWKDPAQNAIAFMESGVEVIPDSQPPQSA